jgi:predicted extracellular nuclease
MATTSRRARALRAAVLTSATALVVSPLALAPTALADPGGHRLVISEVYGGGNNPGAPYRHDFIELYNPTAAAVDVSGMSVQYQSASGTGAPQATTLTGSVPAGGHYLVKEAGGTSNGAALPDADAEGTLNLSQSAGTVFLADQPGALGTRLTSPWANTAVVDLVGYGSSTLAYEGSAPAAGLSAGTSASRAADGKDTDDNRADFAAGAPTPQNAGVVAAPPVEATIEQIQGDGDTSPLAGESVVTDGVVTAAYPTGGLGGFFLQTPGTGGQLDPGTHTTSDGVFVYSPGGVGQVQVGDHVRVQGTVKEFAGLTEVDAPAGGISLLGPAEAVKPATVALPRSDAQRESLEGMLVDLQGPFTVADNYSLNLYGEIGLAAGTRPLPTPTDVADPADPAAVAAVQADNAARSVTLDDGSSWNYLTNATGKNTPLPYLTQDSQIRVGEPVTFTTPMVLDYRNNAWKLQPTAQLTGDGASPVTFGHTRTAVPAGTGGDLHLASFNVLNYFPTTGQEFVAAGGSCSTYKDRAGNPVTVNTCTGPNGEPGPRGAWDEASFQRQQAKIVHAIDHLGADVVSLEEIENSARFGQDRDAAVATLVHALNADAGAGTWDYVRTPSTAGSQDDEDVIRTAFIYKPAAVRPVGESLIDDVAAFDNARDPLAQAFAPAGSQAAAGKFAVIVNHFKSKGSGAADDQDQGQGASNKARTAQARELVAFADRVRTTMGTPRIFLSGDFNAYTREDPMKVLYGASYTDIGSTRAPGEATYLFGGTVGSLDHVLASPSALAMVTGAHVWNINSVEPVALEYSRYNYNATDFYTTQPYRASDHDPLVVGLAAPTSTRVGVQVR